MYSSGGGPSPDLHISQQQIGQTGGSQIGLPVRFVSGQFEGQTIRAELEELQKADLGRKFGSIDRRPLDPPLVVALRLFSVYTLPNGETAEEELNYDDVQTLGLLCTVDLFPAPGMEPEKQHHRPSITHLSSTQQFTFVSSNIYPQRLATGEATPTSASDAFTAASDVVHHVDNIPITESSKRTGDLVGSTFVQPCKIDWRGEKTLMFVFADLAVKAEGTFILRYRVFDIFSKPASQDDLTIQAECYGGPFRVYSTKEFPGLQASTELTKHIARYGVRLNIRETERKRKKTRENVAVAFAKGKRKYESDSSNE